MYIKNQLIKIIDFYSTDGVLAMAILNWLLKSIWLYILNLLLNHMQHQFLYYEIVFSIAYWAKTGVYISINIPFIFTKAVNQTVILVRSFN